MSRPVCIFIALSRPLCQAFYRLVKTSVFSILLLYQDQCVLHFNALSRPVCSAFYCFVKTHVLSIVMPCQDQCFQLTGLDKTLILSTHTGLDKSGLVMPNIQMLTCNSKRPNYRKFDFLNWKLLSWQKLFIFIKSFRLICFDNTSGLCILMLCQDQCKRHFNALSRPVCDFNALSRPEC